SATPFALRRFATLAGAVFAPVVQRGQDVIHADIRPGEGTPGTVCLVAPQNQTPAPQSFRARFRQRLQFGRNLLIGVYGYAHGSSSLAGVRTRRRRVLAPAVSGQSAGRARRVHGQSRWRGDHPRWTHGRRPGRWTSRAPP